MKNLSFYYGVMGSSKTAFCLMRKFEFESNGKSVLLLKPSIDVRDGANTIKSRIGIQAECVTFPPTENLHTKILALNKKFDIILVDEVQFSTREQINQLKKLAIYNDMEVLTFGLKTDFQTNLFEGSKRLLEIADNIVELEMSCPCGNPAMINARFVNGKVATSGDLVDDGRNCDKYVALCYKCYADSLEK